MKGQDVMFERGLNVPDGIHNDIQFNEYRNRGEVLVTIGQLVFGTFAAFALVLLYVAFAWLEA